MSPPLAVSVTDAPGASEVVLVSDHTVVPSTKNATSRIVPAGVATAPWFFTVALGTTLAPNAADVGLTAVTMRSLFVTGGAVVVVVVVGGRVVVVVGGRVVVVAGRSW